MVVHHRGLIGAGGQDGLQARAAVRGLHLVAGPAQDVGQGLPGSGIIIDDENPIRHTSVSGHAHQAGRGWRRRLR